VKNNMTLLVLQLWQLIAQLFFSKLFEAETDPDKRSDIFALICFETKNFDVK